VNSSRGVTLVELVLVIVLTLILAAVAIGGFTGMQTWRAAAAARRTHADLTFARDLALLSSRRTLFVFGKSGESYEIQQEAVPSSGRIAGSVLEHPLTGQAWTVSLDELSAGLRVATGGLPEGGLGFGSDGMPLTDAGKPTRDDVVVRFNSGAQIVIESGTGIGNLSWP